MEYGKLVELVMDKFGCDRMEANVRIATMFFVFANDKQVERVVNALEQEAVR